MNTSSGWSYFLYRRLANLITCELRLPGNHPLALDSKYQVNSLQDVFCHPFYWQIFGWLDAAPNLIVDLGAHCGHFSMLADVCFQARFGEAQPEYLLIEPNAELLPVIEKNLSRSGLCPRHVLEQGLVGARSGDGILWVNPKNYLSSSVQSAPSTKSMKVGYVDLEQLLNGRDIDLLKVDIEGAEYEFAANYPELLGRVKYLMIEIHAEEEKKRQQLNQCLKEAGLQLVGDPLDHGSYLLARYQRR